MLEKVKRTIVENNLLAVGDSVLVALSGGPDSVALLHILTRLRQELKLNLAAVYVNHRIRPRAALKEEQFCWRLCDDLQVVLSIRREDVPALAQKQKKSLEETARDFRYAVFEELARQGNHDKIALGHHRDDRVETILFRILRGTGPAGLRGIPVRRGKIIRPLYEVTKEEILSYLRRHRLEYCVDQSNRSCEFARNYVRNKLLVDIRKHLNPAVDTALLNLSEIASAEEDFLHRYADKVYHKVVRKTVGDKIELDLPRFTGYDTWLRRRLLRYCLAEASESVAAFDKMVIDRLEHLCLGSGKALSLPQGVQAVIVGEKVVLYNKSRSADDYQVVLQPGQLCRLPNVRLNVRARLTSDFDKSWRTERCARRVRLDWEKLAPPLTVRNIRAGDRFQPLGMKGTKKVGDFLTDRKVHRVYRNEIPMVCDRKGIVWLVGYEIADRVKIDASTERVLEIEVNERRKSAAHAV
jgi:tRNA(Ile)-lysidine synthase